MENKKFWGWKVFAACFLISFFITGTLSNCLSLYMNAICTELNMDEATYSLTTLIGTLSMAFSVMVWAPKMQKGNMRILMAIAAAMTMVGYFLYAVSTNLLMLIIASIITKIGVAGSTQMPIALLMTFWFNKNRSTIMSIAYAGSGLGGAVCAPIIGILLDNTNWHKTMIIMGLVCGIVGILCCLILVRKNPQEVGQTPYEGKPGEKEKEISARKKARMEENARIAEWPGVVKKIATKTGAFWFLIVCMFFIGMVSAGVSTHAPNYLAGLGWSTTKAGYVVSVFSLACIAGTVLGGVMFDIIGPVKSILFAVIFAAASLVFLIGVGASMFLACSYAVLLGLAMCMPRMVPAILVSRCFGLKGYASVYSFINLSFLVGAAIGSVVTGIFAKTVGYEAAWVFYAVMCAFIWILAAAAVKNSDKLRKIYPDGSPDEEENKESK